MGLFSKKRDDGEGGALPALPKLPELPNLDNQSNHLQQLPSFPSGMTGDKFSRSAIKDAVSGKKEVDEEKDADDFLDEIRTMPKVPQPPQTPRTRDIEDSTVPKHFREAAKVVQKAEPVFIRIDKYERALEVFEKSKEKVIEIEKMLKDLKSLKEKESKELEDWENEIETAKTQIERVDKELFSKIE